jgi:tetratricopeptide (TPR) repeat protein
MREKAKDLIEEGHRQLKEGDWETASKVFGEALELIEKEGGSDDDRRLLAEVLRKRAHADSRMGEFERAVTQHKRAMDISKSVDDHAGEADALRGLGYVHWLKSDFQMALIFYDMVFEKASLTGDMEIIGRTRIELGNVYNSMGDRERAREEYSQAINILKTTDNKNELARAYNNLGDCYIRSGDLEEAITVLRQCMDLADTIGDMTIKGWAAFNAADCFTRMGESKIAKQYLETALDVLEESDDRIGVGSSLRVYGLTLTAEKEYVLAEDAFDKSIAIFAELDMPAREGETLKSKAKMFIDKGDIGAAIETLERAVEVFQEGNQEKDAREARDLIEKLKG